MSMADTRWPIVLLLVLSGASAARAQEAPKAEPPPLGLADPDIKTMQLARFAPSGHVQQILKLTLVQPDCSSAGLPVARIRTPAEHGEITLDVGDQFPGFAANTVHADCNDKKVPGVAVLYTSKPAFTGIDQADVTFIYPDGSAANFHVTIKVL